MKNRRRPFGYEMKRGQNCINEAEAEIVKEIFIAYTEGHSYQQLANRMNAGSVVYCTPDKPWNKNVIARVLQNRTYLGNENYPQIISEELFQQVAQIRPDAGKAAGCMKKHKAMRHLLRCPICGKTLTQCWKNRWICSECEEITITINSEMIFQTLWELLGMINADTEMIKTPKSDIDIYGTDTDREKFLNMLDRHDFDEAAAQAQVLKMASQRLNDISSADYETVRIRHILSSGDITEENMAMIYCHIAAAVNLDPNGQITVILKNGQRFKGGTDHDGKHA